MEPSLSAPASVRPSGEYATDVNFSGPASVRSIRPRAKSHSAHGTIAGRRSELHAIGCENQLLDRIVMTVQYAEAASLFDVPETNRLVRAGRGEQLAVRMEGHSEGMRGMFPERGQPFARGDVPEADVVLLRQVSRGQDAAIR